MKETTVPLTQNTKRLWKRMGGGVHTDGNSSPRHRRWKADHVEQHDAEHTASGQSHARGRAYMCIEM